MEDLLYLYSGGTGISLDHVSDIDMGEDTASDVIVEEDWATLFAPAQSIECDGGTGGSWKPDTFTRPGTTRGRHIRQTIPATDKFGCCREKESGMTSHRASK
jgi:hypothetical protein